MSRYLRYFFIPSLSVMIVAAVLSVLFQPLSGDLTRIGRWAERDFGWNSQQPRISIMKNGGRVNASQVLVLGDSFSRGNSWQSILAAKSGKDFLSFHYRDVGCLDNWLQYALDNTSAHTVIIESVERSFVGLFEALRPCAKRVPMPFENVAKSSLPTRATWPPTVSVSYAYMTAINSLRMFQSESHSVRGKQVVNAPLRNACASFSNRRADRLLYLADDEDQQNWDPGAVNRAIATLQRIQVLFEAHGKHFLFLLVPDKLSIYRHCLRDVSGLPERLPIIDRLNMAGVHAPDLFAPLRGEVGRAVDLYRPNDTHLSESGYLLMAAYTGEYLDRSDLW